MIDDEDLRCPDCGELATRTNPYGPWVFFCSPCSRSWGHPQHMTEYESAIELHQAKKAEKK